MRVLQNGGGQERWVPFRDLEGFYKGSFLDLAVFSGSIKKDLLRVQGL